MRNILNYIIIFLLLIVILSSFNMIFNIASTIGVIYFKEVLFASLFIYIFILYYRNKLGYKLSNKSMILNVACAFCFPFGLMLPIVEFNITIPENKYILMSVVNYTLLISFYILIAFQGNKDKVDG